MINPDTRTYNARLFKKGNLRSWLHNLRFEWFARTVRRLDPRPLRIIELGCFDGRLLDFCPSGLEHYEGFDADWEGGLSAAQQTWGDNPTHRFTKATIPSDLAHLKDDAFTVAVALETLEHIPPDLVDAYLAELSRVTNGHLIVSVPNEKGLVFLAKYIAKRLFVGAGESYTPQEVLWAILGRSERIPRNDHKGFDYALLASQIGRHFNIVAMRGLPIGWLPSLSFTVTILARSRKSRGSDAR